MVLLFKKALELFSTSGMPSKFQGRKSNVTFLLHKAEVKFCHES